MCELFSVVGCNITLILVGIRKKSKSVKKPDTVKARNRWFTAEVSII